MIYKTIGEIIEIQKYRNKDLSANTLLGINIEKKFVPSVANIVGTDLSTYKIVKKGRFACNRMHVGRDRVLPISLSDIDEEFIVSPAYDVFSVKESEGVLSEYLMIRFLRKEFDKEARFYTDGDVRGGLPRESFCNIKIPVPSAEEQKKIIKRFNTIQKRINLNNSIIQKLEETAQTLYKHRFVDFEFPDLQNHSYTKYKSEGGEMIRNKELEKEIPKGRKVETLLDNLLTKIIKSGINKFEGEKIYLATAEVTGNEINFSAPKITYQNRGSRANMQPIKHSVWFAKMKNTKKAIYFGDYSTELIDNIILSTGFQGLECKENYFLEYIRCFINNDKFEELKDSLAIGSTQEAINSDDIAQIPLLVPNEQYLKNFHEKLKLFYENIFKRMLLNKSLYQFKDTYLQSI